MPVLQIARMGQPVLRTPAAPVDVPADAQTRQLLEDMVETMDAAGGTGLAAPQVFRPVRAIVFVVGAARQRRSLGLDAGGHPGVDYGVPLTRLLNPEIAPLDVTVEEDDEACLSIPGLTGRVPRWRHIRYRGFAPDGTPVERTASGFHARLVQHEVDHLDGVLYPERMRDLATLAFTSEIATSRADGPTGTADVGPDAPGPGDKGDDDA